MEVLGGEGATVLECRYFSLKRQCKIMEDRNRDLEEDLRGVDKRLRECEDGWAREKDGRRGEGEGRVRVERERDEAIRDLVHLRGEVEGLKRERGRFRERCKREGEGRIRRLEREREEEKRGLEDEIERLKGENCRERRRGRKLEDCVKRLEGEVEEAERSAGEKAEEISGELLRKMRSSLVSHSSSSKNKMDEAIRKIKETYVPLEIHREIMDRVRREYEESRNGVVEAMQQKLTLGIAAADVKVRGREERRKERSDSKSFTHPSCISNNLQLVPSLLPARSINLLGGNWKRQGSRWRRGGLGRGW